VLCEAVPGSGTVLGAGRIDVAEVDFGDAGWPAGVRMAEEGASRGILSVGVCWCGVGGGPERTVCEDHVAQHAIEVGSHVRRRKETVGVGLAILGAEGWRTNSPLYMRMCMGMDELAFGEILDQGEESTV
jgi:hypothetical protein